jgi:hypothetical protein
MQFWVVSCNVRANQDKCRGIEKSLDWFLATPTGSNLGNEWAGILFFSRLVANLEASTKN